MSFRLVSLLVVLIVCDAGPSHAEQAAIDLNLLDTRLNNLESQAIQRQGRDRNLIDLLNRQDERAARQALNAAKTKRFRNVAVPLLDRKFERARRPTGRIGPR